MQIGVDSKRAVENRWIFVMDDDEISRTALQFMLADENETHEIDSLAAACSKASVAPPDLVLLGTSFQQTPGASVVARLKALLAPAKLILVASDKDDPQIAAGMSQGADGVIIKPLKLETVRRKVDLALGRQVPIGIVVV